MNLADKKSLAGPKSEFLIYMTRSSFNEHAKEDKKNSGMLHEDKETGGIDMNTLSVETQGRMTPMAIAKDPAMLDQNIIGFTPVIISIKPVMTLSFLGLDDSDVPQEQLPEKEQLYVKEI